MRCQDFAELISPAAQHLLHIGSIQAEAAQCYGSRKIKVWQMQRLGPPPSRLPVGSFDGVIVDVEELPPRERIARIDALLPLLTPNSWVGFVFPGTIRDGELVHSADVELLHRGLIRFKLIQLPPDAQGHHRLGIVAVRKTYNPVEQAFDEARQGSYELAIRMLNEIPDELIGTPENLSYLAAERQRIYLEWQQSLPHGEPVHKLFFKARREFAQVTTALPAFHAAYRYEARFWLHLGNSRMARRVLNSVLHIEANETTRDLLKTVPSSTIDPEQPEIPPEWSGTRRPPRLLILTHDHSDYGMDSLYDGLCRLIGSSNVVEYPWKPTLHGQCVEAAQNYPCVFHYPSDRFSLDQLIEQLRDHRFDIIVYADVVQMDRSKEVKQLLKAAPDLPMVVYDSWDSCFTPVAQIARYTGERPIELIFKREMLQGVDYGANTIPLTFGYSDDAAAETITDPKTVDFFWAGKRVWSLRPLFLPRIEEKLGRAFQSTYDQAEYARQLRHARIGLSLFGSGFDSVRYWEVPAHGAMLFAEEPPIRIPHNFKDGESAVFFGDVADLEEKLDYYLAHLDETRAIAVEGHNHFLRYHTTSARAKQFLGYLEKHLVW